MIEIIQAEEIHFPVIQDIANKTWAPTFENILSKEQIEYMLDQMYSINSLKKQIQKKNNVFLLAVKNNKYLAYASYELHYGLEPKTKLHKIYILPEEHGQGIGKLMIQYIKQIALANEDQWITLNVNRNNKAVDFYKKIGFEIKLQEDIDIGKGYLMEDYVMELKIK
jgi:diamine N-acetyltransferase